MAFRNPDGSIALVVKNISGGTQTFGVSYDGMTISYTLVPNALATLTLAGSGGGGGDTSATATPAGLAAEDTTATSTG